MGLTLFYYSYFLFLVIITKVEPPNHVFGKMINVCIIIIIIILYYYYLFYYKYKLYGYFGAVRIVEPYLF